MAACCLQRSGPRREVAGGRPRYARQVPRIVAIVAMSCAICSVAWKSTRTLNLPSGCANPPRARTASSSGSAIMKRPRSDRRGEKLRSLRDTESGEMVHAGSPAFWAGLFRTLIFLRRTAAPTTRSVV
jgi:hypothetical protein